jgi:hypothetical protein
VTQWHIDGSEMDYEGPTPEEELRGKLKHLADETIEQVAEIGKELGRMLQAKIDSLETALATAQRELTEAQEKAERWYRIGWQKIHNTRYWVRKSKRLESERDEANRQRGIAAKLAESNAKQVEHYATRLGKAESERNALAAQVGQMREALEWYAGADTYKPISDPKIARPMMPVEFDRGAFAKAALSQPTPHEQEWSAMRDALKFYADKDLYSKVNRPYGAPIFSDWGERARQALKVQP